MRILKTVLLLSLMFTASAFAHPVSFQGATSLMSYNSEDENEVLATYSIRNYLAVGLTYQREGQVYYTVPRVNFLVQRWNNEDSQANIYASAGYGTERSYDETVGVGLGALEVDWESRKYYTSAQYTRFIRKDSDKVDRVDFETIKLRAGVAPYLAEFNEINSWLILQTEKMNDKQWELTPFIRMFYKNVLIELGAGFNGSYAFNFMVHF